MGFYLLDHPPARPQFYPTRAATPTYAYGVHTSESVKDDVDRDAGAENVANFIVNRTEAPGSYHDLWDSDSTVPMLPSSYTAFAIAASGFNSRTLSGSYACRRSELHPDDPWTVKATILGGRTVRDRWVALGIDPEYAAVWLPASEALVRPCLFNHGDAQPKDRVDAFVGLDVQDELQRMFTAAVLEGDWPTGDKTPKPKEWDEMATKDEIEKLVSDVVAREAHKNKCFYDPAEGPSPVHYEMLAGGRWRRAIKPGGELQHLINAGIISYPEPMPGVIIARAELIG